MTVATCTGLPLLTPSTVTTAVRLPLAVGSVVKVTVRELDDALVTVPTAPLLKLTLSLAEVGSKVEPVMVIVDAVAGQTGRAGGHCLQLEGTDVERFGGCRERAT